MYLNDHQRTKFYESLGMNTRQYNIEVIQETNKTAGRVFPIILDVDRPEFFQIMDSCVKDYLKILAIAESNQSKFSQTIQKFPSIVALGWKMLRLYLMKPIDMTAKAGTVN
jgi:magnesium-protoporphyrin IX monomethyl ester (oxidative) cyclase